MPSPIEEQFLAAWQRYFPHLPLAAEYPLYGGRYRIDFAYVPAKIAVELDGYEYHRDRDRFTEDRQRDRALQRDGWRVLHFSGREIYQNVDACVQEVYVVIVQHSPILGGPVERVPWRSGRQYLVPPEPASTATSSPSFGTPITIAVKSCVLAIYLVCLLLLAGVALFMILGGLASLIKI